MTDMIERAGRAALCGWNGVGTDDATMAAEWERMGPATRAAWMRAIRAAIAAMREPTPAMVSAAGYHGIKTRHDVLEWVDYHDWPRMIDAALSEGDKP